MKINRNFRYQIALIALFLLLIRTNAYAETYVLFTVDVESMSTGNPATNIWGQFEGTNEKWGITRLMDEFDHFGVKGTFYLNVYEIAAYGESQLKNAAVEIDSRGHDLQLHTHPRAMFDVQDMAGETYETQLEILSTGKDLIFDWTEKVVNAHRAGAYMADSVTLEAARATGLDIDSSASFATGSPLATDIKIENTVHNIDGVLELPITYYNQVSIGSWHSPRIVDIEATTLREFMFILDEASRAGLCSVNIMMHSFSLSRYGKPDPKIAERLNELLVFISNRDDFSVVTTSEFGDLVRNENVCASEQNFVPETGIWLTYLRSLEHFNRGIKNLVVAVIPPIAIALLLAAIAVFRLRP